MRQFKKLFSFFILLVLACLALLVFVSATSEVFGQRYGGIRGDLAYSLVEADDGGFVLAGFTYSFGPGVDDVWLVKTDPSGNLEWNKTFGGSAGDAAYSLIKTSDGGYAISWQNWFI